VQEAGGETGGNRERQGAAGLFHLQPKFPASFAGDGVVVGAITGPSPLFFAFCLARALDATAPSALRRPASTNRFLSRRHTMGCPSDTTTTPGTPPPDTIELGGELSGMPGACDADDGPDGPTAVDATADLDAAAAEQPSLNPNSRKRPRRRSSATNLRRPSMQTRAQGNKCLSSTTLQIIVAATQPTDDDKPAPLLTTWAGDLPLLPPIKRGIQSERQLEFSRPLGVERDEFNVSTGALLLAPGLARLPS